MGNLAGDLRAAWDTYEPQRRAELESVRLYQEANRELNELNVKRGRLGLAHVSEHQPSQVSQGFTQAAVYSPPPKTWRDDLDTELLSIVKRYLSEGSA
jgi:hypothetical protein